MGDTQPSRRLALSSQGKPTDGRDLVQPIGFDRRDQQGGVRRHMETRLAFHDRIRPYLSLAGYQQGFPIFLIHLNLPAIEIGLQGLLHGDVRVIDEEIGRLTVEGVPVRVIAQRANDNESQGAGGGLVAAPLRQKTGAFAPSVVLSNQHEGRPTNQQQYCRSFY
jgi:hypothetical protein